MVSKITPSEVQQRAKAEEIVYIDVRENGEYRREHIAEAKLLPLSTFNPEEVLKSVNSNAAICVYCASGGRSADASKKLEEAQAKNPSAFGKIQIFDMVGGMSGWRLAGLPVLEDKNAPLPIIRQVHLIASTLIITGSLLSQFVNKNFIVLPIMVGCGLFVAGATGFCGMAVVLQRLPYNKSQTCSPCSTS